MITGTQVHNLEIDDTVNGIAVARMKLGVRFRKQDSLPTGLCLSFDKQTFDDNDWETNAGQGFSKEGKPDVGVRFKIVKGVSAFTYLNACVLEHSRSCSPTVAY